MCMHIILAFRSPILYLCTVIRFLLTQLSQTINIQFIYIYHEIHNIQKSQGRE